MNEKKTKLEYEAPTIKVEKVPIEDSYCISRINNESMRYLTTPDGGDEWDW